MTMLKVVEILAQSEKSWAGRRAARGSGGCQDGAQHQIDYVKEMEATVENDRIIYYRLNVKISFAIEGR